MKIHDQNMKNSTLPRLDEFPPESESVTTYDRRCFKLYIMLLDADASCEDWRGAYKRIFEIAHIENQERSYRHYQAHLKRAKWMSATGYRQLL